MFVIKEMIIHGSAGKRSAKIDIFIKIELESKTNETKTACPPGSAPPVINHGFSVVLFYLHRRKTIKWGAHQFQAG